jgi:glycosyltransferase involved in cell wall biosynthesis
LVLNGAKLPERFAETKIPKRLIFSGVMDFAPNYEGALWFLNKVFPLVLKQHPDATLVLAGMNPVRELTERASKNVRVTGFVEDMGTEISCSSLYVSPMISGSGFKNKVVEALINGTYIVGTRLSFEFLPPELRGLLSAVDGAEEMAGAINTFLDDPTPFEERLQRIQSVVMSQFSWRNRSGDFLHLLDDAYTAHFGRRQSPAKVEMESIATLSGGSAPSVASVGSSLPLRN